MAVDREFLRNANLFPAVKIVLEKLINVLDAAPFIADVTASAAELNILDGATVTFAELNTAADQSAQTETLTADGAISVLKRITKLADTGTGAYTLAAPDATLLGMTKLIEMTTDNGDVTVDLTNVVGTPAAETTATFSAVGQMLVLTAGVSKWLYVNTTAALS
jgi:hypothetical protein